MLYAGFVAQPEMDINWMDGLGSPSDQNPPLSFRVVAGRLFFGEILISPFLGAGSEVERVSAETESNLEGHDYRVTFTLLPSCHSVSFF